MAQDTDEDRIRIKAHQIWESEGHPHGRDEDHWAQAKEIIAIEDSLHDTLLPRTTGVEEPIEPTQAVEPYGDVPNLTDQGEHDLTSTDREPESTKPSHAVYTMGDSIGHVARPLPSTASDGDDLETVSPAPKVAAVTPTPRKPMLGSPAPRPAKSASPKTPAVPKTASASPKPAPATASGAAPATGSAPVTGKGGAKATGAPASVTKTSSKPQPKP